MIVTNILFRTDNIYIPPDEILKLIDDFKYTKASQRIIRDSRKLDLKEKTFVRRASYILSNFGMTRGGRLRDIKEKKEILHQCWDEVGDRLIKINDSVIKSGYSRDRFLLELGDSDREELTTEIWLITKKLLPHTMGDTSYGLVGASKILFSVFPEIVLPVDNSQWLHVFKTVDLGDVIRQMTSEIQLWEDATGKLLNEIDPKNRLSTLPSIYNVMAMAARPKGTKNKT